MRHDRWHLSSFGWCVRWVGNCYVVELRSSAFHGGTSDGQPATSLSNDFHILLRPQSLAVWPLPHERRTFTSPLGCDLASGYGCCSIPSRSCIMFHWTLAHSWRRRTACRCSCSCNRNGEGLFPRTIFVVLNFMMHPCRTVLRSVLLQAKTVSNVLVTGEMMNTDAERTTRPGLRTDTTGTGVMKTTTTTAVTIAIAIDRTLVG